MLQTRQPSLRRFWYPVMPLAHLQAGPRPFKLLGEPLVLYCDSAGEPAALADRCCHRTAQLSKGFVEGDRLVCGYHGWTYDRTGRCVRIPQRDDNLIPASSKVPAYECAARYGYVWVALADPLTPIPEFEEAADPAFRQIDQFYEPWRIASFRLMENSFDMAHIAFTHRTSFGIVDEPRPPSMRITPLEYGLASYVETPVRNHDEKARAVTGTTEARTMRTMHGRWWMPFIRRLGIVYPNGLRHSIITCATPMDDDTSMVLQWTYRNDREEDVPAKDIIAFDRQVTLEDQHILESTEYDVCLDTRRRVEFHMATDEPGLLMRRKLLDLLREHGEEEVHGIP
jgi:phenylpropionate dioxygenase-like ring-hydroxylating dioxygenase large terminal subunit